MIKFRTINPPPPSVRQSLKNETASLSYEAKVDECIDKFKMAVRSQQKGWRNESLKMLRELASHGIIKGVEGTAAEEAERDRKSMKEGGITVERLRFLIHRTLGQSILYMLSSPPGRHGHSSHPTAFGCAHIRTDLTPSELEILGEAFEHLRQATEKEPNDSQGWYILGHCALVSGLLATARHAFEAGIKACKRISGLSYGEGATGRKKKPIAQFNTFAAAEGADAEYASTTHFITPAYISALTPTGWWCLLHLCEVLVKQGDCAAIDAIAGAVKASDPTVALPLPGISLEDFAESRVSPYAFSAMARRPARLLRGNARESNKVYQPSSVQTLTIRGSDVTWHKVGSLLLGVLSDISAWDTSSLDDRYPTLVKFDVEHEVGTKGSPVSEHFTQAPGDRLQGETRGVQLRRRNSVASMSNTSIESSLSDDSESEESRSGESKRKGYDSSSDVPSKRRSTRSSRAPDTISRSYSSASHRASGTLVAQSQDERSQLIVLPHSTDYDTAFMGLIERWLGEIGWVSADVDAPAWPAWAWAADRKQWDDIISRWLTASLRGSKWRRKSRKSAANAPASQDDMLTTPFYNEAFVRHILADGCNPQQLPDVQNAFAASSAAASARAVRKFTTNMGAAQPVPAVSGLCALALSVLSSGCDDGIVPLFSAEDVATIVEVLWHVHDAILDHRALEPGGGIGATDFPPGQQQEHCLDGVWRAVTALELISSYMVLEECGLLKSRSSVSRVELELMRCDWQRALDLALLSLPSDEVQESWPLRARLVVVSVKLRREWSLYQLAAVEGRVAECREALSRCQWLHSSLCKASGDDYDTSLLPLCSKSGRRADAELLESRATHLETFCCVIDATKAADKGEFDEVVRVLEPHLPRNLAANGERSDCPFLTSMHENLALLGLLGMAYRCRSEYAKSLCVVAASIRLILKGLTRDAPSLCTGRGEDSVTKILHKLNTCIGEMASLVACLLAPATSDSTGGAQSSVTLCQCQLKLPWSGESDRTSVDLLVSPILCLLNLALIATHRFQLGPFQVSASPSNVECPAEILASLAVRVWELVVRIWDHHPVTRAFYDNRIGSGDEETHDPSSDGTSASQSLEATDTFNFIVVTEEIHHILGERGICCQDNGRLVRCCLCIYSRLHVASGRGEVLWDDISQCTYCLYQLKVDPDGTAIEEHNTPRCGLSREDALCLYDLVRPVVIARIQQPRGTTLRSEVRAALEKLAEAIRSLDQERSAVLLYNRTVINNYLCRVPSFSFDELQRCFGIERGGDLASNGEPASLSLLSTYSAGQPQAYKTLFYVQGAMLHDLVRSRTRVQPNQQTEDLQEVIEHYQLNLALNPFCGHAWYLLGLAYTDMANSMLLYSASEVRQSLYEIGEMQHKALLCYAQAFKRIGGVSNESRVRLSFYSDPESGYCDTATLRLRSSAALLLYLMASRPMSLVGFERMTPTSNDGDPRQQQQQRLGHDSDGYWGGQACRLSNQLSSRFAVHKQLKAPPSSRVYKLAAHLFGATRGIDLGNWMWTYMLGKSLSKRGMVNEACMCYLKAAFISSKGTTELVPDGVSSRGASLQYQLVDASIEPVSKLLSTLAKALLSTTMEADTASKYLNALVSQTNLRSREGAEAEAPTTGDACLREFTRMRYMTAQLCQLDKRNWHHKPKYLLAWLDFHVFGDFESAKGELYSLIQMRSTTKQLASFYKTEFESPGKHYLYLEKYIRLLVLVLRNLKDRDDLQVLYKKVAKGEASLFNSHELSMLIKDTLEELLEPATEAKSGQEEVAPLVADDSSGARLSSPANNDTAPPAANSDGDLDET